MIVWGLEKELSKAVHTYFYGDTEYDATAGLEPAFGPADTLTMVCVEKMIYYDFDLLLADIQYFKRYVAKDMVQEHKGNHIHFGFTNIEDYKNPYNATIFAWYPVFLYALYKEYPQLVYTLSPQGRNVLSTFAGKDNEFFDSILALFGNDVTLLKEFVDSNTPFDKIVYYFITFGFNAGRTHSAVALHGMGKYPGDTDIKLLTWEFRANEAPFMLGGGMMVIAALSYAIYMADILQKYQNDTHIQSHAKHIWLQYIQQPVPLSRLLDSIQFDFGNNIVEVMHYAHNKFPETIPQAYVYMWEDYITKKYDPIIFHHATLQEMWELIDQTIASYFSSEIQIHHIQKAEKEIITHLLQNKHDTTKILSTLIPSTNNHSQRTQLMKSR